MRHKFLRKLLIIILNGNFLFLPSAYGSGIKSIWKNVDTTVYGASSTRDQQAGYWSGSGGRVRVSDKRLQLFSVTEPSISSGGCSSISVFTGAFSAVNGSELVSLAENIGSAAPVYAFHLGMKTYAPQIENGIKDIRNMILELSGKSISTCEATRQLFATGLPKDSAAYEMVCREQKGATGMDFFGANKGCRDREAQKAEMAKAQKKDPESMLYNANLFILAANKAKIPDDMRANMMSMLGTVIIREGVVSVYRSLATDLKSWETYLAGGSDGARYDCNDKECLTPRLVTNVVISPEASYKGQTKAKLDGLKIKLYSQEEEFSLDEEAFLSSIGGTFPVFNYLVIEAISNVNILDTGSEVVASYVVLAHLKEMISEISRTVEQLKSKQLDPKHLVSYLKELERVERYARNQWDSVSSKAEIIETRAKRVEQHLMSRERG